VDELQNLISSSSSTDTSLVKFSGRSDCPVYTKPLTDKQKERRTLDKMNSNYIHNSTQHSLYRKSTSLSARAMVSRSSFCMADSSLLP